MRKFGIMIDKMLYYCCCTYLFEFFPIFVTFAQLLPASFGTKACVLGLRDIPKHREGIEEPESKQGKFHVHPWHSQKSGFKKNRKNLKAPTQIAPTKIQNQNPCLQFLLSWFFCCACSAFQMEPVQVAEG